MKVNQNFRKFSGVILLSLLANCGKDDKNGGAVTTGKVDTSSYKNSADGETMKTKGADAEKLLSGADEKFAKFTSKKFAFFTAWPSTALGEYIEKCMPKETKTGEVTTTDAGVVTTGYSCEYLGEDSKSVTCAIDEIVTKGVTKITATCSNGKSITDASVTGRSSSKTQGSSTGDGKDDVTGIFAEAPKDCETAITSVKGMYAQGQKQLSQMVAGLKDKETLAGTYTSAGDKSTAMVVEEVKDSNAAIAYKFSSPEGAKGFTASGSMTAGSSDDLIVMTYDADLTMDFSEIFANLPAATNKLTDSPRFELASPEETKSLKMAMSMKFKIEADLKKEAIDFEMSSTTTVNDQTMIATGLISIQGGTKPGVTMDMTMNGKDGEGVDQSAKVSTSVVFVDDAHLEITGSGVVKGESKVFGYLLTKSADGTCAVTVAAP